MCLINEGHSAILNDKAEAARCHLLFSRFLNCFLNELQLWGPGAVIPLERSGNDEIQNFKVWWMSAPDLVCVWGHPHAPGAISTAESLYCGKKKKKKMHMSSISVTIRDAVYNYPFVFSSSRWKWRIYSVCASCSRCCGVYESKFSVKITNMAEWWAEQPPHRGCNVRKIRAHWWTSLN